MLALRQPAGLLVREQAPGRHRKTVLTEHIRLEGRLLMAVVERHASPDPLQLPLGGLEPLSHDGEKAHGHLWLLAQHSLHVDPAHDAYAGGCYRLGVVSCMPCPIRLISPKTEPSVRVATISLRPSGVRR
jgi:hypothetical protein